MTSIIEKVPCNEDVDNQEIYQDSYTPIDPEEYVKYQIHNANIANYPFPHLYLQNIFPQEYYESIIENMPGNDFYTSISDTGRTHGYQDRYIVDFKKTGFGKLPDAQKEFWDNLSAWLMGESFLSALISKFSPYIEKRVQGISGTVTARQSGLLVRDRTGYSIGPHTDAPHKMLTLLFYLPEDNSMSHLGTSIYTPVKESFRCNGGPHYAFDMFKKIKTVDFSPNALFAFFKTDRSFHGVEVIRDEEVERNLIIYNVNLTGK